MSNVKEQIIGAVAIMNEKDAEKVWELIQSTFTLSNLEEELPTADEIVALQAFQNGETDYQPSISQEELKKELGFN